MSAGANLKWGLVGYGDLAGKRSAAALRTAAGSELVGVWGRQAERTRQFAAQHQISRAHDSLASLLASGIDAVYVCTPPDSHAEYALAAIAAGKHVLVEKPMAAAVPDCEAMVKSARAKGTVLGVAYYRRAFPKMRKIKELIAGGMLGTPTWVNIANHCWYNPGPRDPKGWRVEKAHSGGAGALADLGVHRLDLLDYWMGPSQVVFRDLHHLVQGFEVEDGSSIVLKLAGGAPVHAYFSWNTKTFIDRFELVGSEGKLIADPLDGPSLVVWRGANREEMLIEPPANLHLPCVEDFVQAVREGREPLCSGEAGLRASRLLAQVLS